MKRFLQRLYLSQKHAKRTLTSSNETDSKFKSILYSRQDRVANIKLNRPQALDAIDEHLPSEIEEAVRLANNDDRVRVILLSGSGKAFCSGYDLKKFGDTLRG